MPGRRKVTSRVELERIALALFEERGFNETTVDDIAEAAGIGRRTFFRYYDSKNDVVWGDFDAMLTDFDKALSAATTDRPLFDTVRDQVVLFNTLPPDAIESHRQRMSLILYVPALQAHSTLRYEQWRAVVARLASRYYGEPETALLHQLVGHLALAAAVTAYEQWLTHPETELAPLIRSAFDAVALPGSQ